MTILNKLLIQDGDRVQLRFISVIERDAWLYAAECCITSQTCKHKADLVALVSTDPSRSPTIVNAGQPSLPLHFHHRL
jgi:hypothetical protein